MPELLTTLIEIANKDASVYRFDYFLWAGKSAFNGHDTFGCPSILQTSHTNLAAARGHPSIPNPDQTLWCVFTTLRGDVEKPSLRLITPRFRMVREEICNLPRARRRGYFVGVYYT